MNDDFIYKESLACCLDNLEAAIVSLEDLIDEDGQIHNWSEHLQDLYEKIRRRFEQ